MQFIRPRSGCNPRLLCLTMEEPKQSAEARGSGLSRRYRSSIALSHFFGRTTPDHAGACPYRVQCRIARCDAAADDGEITSKHQTEDFACEMRLPRPRNLRAKRLPVQSLGKSGLVCPVHVRRAGRPTARFVNARPATAAGFSHSLSE